MPTRGSQWTLMEGHTGAGGVSGRAVLQTWAIQRSAPVTPTSSVHIHSKDTPSVTDAVAMSSPVPLLRDSGQGLHREEELGEVGPPSLLPLPPGRSPPGGPLG